jgi:translation initiation factor 3 subunit A
VAQLGSTLNKVANSLTVKLGSEDLEKKAVASRKEYFKKVNEAVDEEHEYALERKKMIERRKEGLERVQLDRQNEEQRIKDIEEDRRQKIDAQRLDQEQKVREEDKRRKLVARQDLLRMQKELERYNVIMAEDVLMELTPAARQGLLTDAKNEAVKAKEDEGRRVNEQAKRLDHITRALRIEAAEVIAKKYGEQVEEDKAIFQAKLIERQAMGSKQHDLDLEEKRRLARMLSVRAVFEDSLLKQQRLVYDKKISALRAKALNEFRLNNISKARYMYDNESERQRQEEEEEQYR